MSFGGGQSNATPWQRNVMPAHPQTSNFHQAPPHLFMQSSQPTNMAAFGGHGGGLQTTIFSNAGQRTVTFPQPVRSGLNPVAFQQAPVGAGNIGGGSGSTSGGGGGGNLSQQHYNAIGTVTKINNDYGLVNDEVFFYRNVCKGVEPKLGDRVVFEATYTSGGQFKWNATRIQLMQQPQPLLGSNKGHVGYNSNPSNDGYHRGLPMHRHNSPKRCSPLRGGGSSNLISDRHDRDRRNRERDRIRRSRERDDNEIDRKRRREDRERSRDRDRDRDRVVGKNIGGNMGGGSGGGGGISNFDSGRGGNAGRIDRDRDRNNDGIIRRDRDIDRERDERDRERDRLREKDLQMSRSTNKNRRIRPMRRYTFQIPKFRLTYKTADVQELRRRYTTMYIPSDFFYAKLNWSEIFTPENSFSLQRPCQFHIMHKMINSPLTASIDKGTSQLPESETSIDPPDANYAYSAKVMLLSLPTMSELYEKCFENDDNGGYTEGTHPSRLISFLVGIRGRNEPMAIGGPWSPSLDGEDPEKDPSVLIRTAIRTCRTMTGIDLSNCTQWYRFLELYYHRGEYKNTEKNSSVSSRVETVVIFLPDVHSCLPSVEQWTQLTQTYKKAGENAVMRPPVSTSSVSGSGKSKSSNTDPEEAAITTPLKGGNKQQDAVSLTPTAETPTKGKDNDGLSKSSPSLSSSNTSQVADSLDESKDNNTGGHSANAEEKDVSLPKDGEPTHYSLLDIKTMKVQELRDELLARKLSDKGIRSVLATRLSKSLSAEKAEETKLKKEVVSADVRSNQIKTKDVELTKKKQCNSNTKETKNEENENVAGVDLSKTKASGCTTAKNTTKIGKGGEKENGNDAGDDSEEWSELIDFEMSDIVILDEYDSSKNPEDNIVNEPKELDEKEKSQLIRRYTLPSQSHIIVHPNKNAKGGKFYCAIMSLSVLLDYHLEDTKERFFEVSLFAELFNEMLMRDFGFNIYKEIYLHKGNSGNENTTAAGAEKSVSGGTKDDLVDKSEDKSKLKDITKDTNSTPEEHLSKEHDDDSQSLKLDIRKHKSYTNDKDTNRDNRSASKDGKMIVVKPELLLSFIYFDVSYCGYIFDKDLEDLFLLLGLNLSRSQVKKYISKLSTRQAIYYRKLTDKEESLDNLNAIKNESDEMEEEEVKRIATGNWIYENIYKGPTNQLTNELKKESEDADSSNTDLITYKGAVIDVGKLLEQMKRVEKNYSNLDKLHTDLQKKHAELSRDHSKSTNRIKDLQGEVKSLNRKLTDTNQELSSINRKYNDQQNTLSYIYHRVAPYFPREKEKDLYKTDNRANSKDKDLDKKKETLKSKDKDKEKDKIKDVETVTEKNNSDKDSLTTTQQMPNKIIDKVEVKVENIEVDAVKKEKDTLENTTAVTDTVLK